MVKVKAGVGLDRGVAHTAFTVVPVGSPAICGGAWTVLLAILGVFLFGSGLTPLY